MVCVVSMNVGAQQGQEWASGSRTVHMQLSHPAWTLRTEFGALNDLYMLVTAEPWGQSQALYFNLNI